MLERPQILPTYSYVAHSDVRTSKEGLNQQAGNRCQLKEVDEPSEESDFVLRLGHALIEGLAQ